jgi:hypothetical protein
LCDKQRVTDSVVPRQQLAFDRLTRNDLSIMALAHR